MDLTSALLKEHTKKQAVQITEYVGINERKFKALVEAFLKGPYRLTQRASWPLNLCVEKHPHLIIPHLQRILKFLKTPGIHNAVKRNTLRMLQFIEIPKAFHSILIELCFQFLENKKEAVAIKVFSMAILSRITETYPELQNELLVVIEDQLPYSSAAFKSRAKKVLRTIRTRQAGNNKNKKIKIKTT